MGRIGITYNDVVKAIATLQGMQKNTTVDNIRELMGTGSKSTIARFLRDWKATQGLASDSNTVLPNDLLNMVTGLWQAIQDKADSQADIEIAAVKTKMLEIEQSLAKQNQLYATAQANIHALEERTHRQSDEITALNKSLASEEKEKLKLTERNTLYEAKITESQAEIERLHVLLKHVQDNLEHYQLATQQLRQEQLLQIEKQKNEYDQKIAQQQALIDETLSCRNQLEIEHQHLKKMYDTLTDAHQSQLAAHETIKESLAQVKFAKDAMQNENQLLIQKNEKLVKENEAKNAVAMESGIQLKLNSEKITLLESELSHANNKIRTLRHEHQFTLQENANLQGQLKQLQSILAAKKSILVD